MSPYRWEFGLDFTIFLHPCVRALLVTDIHLRGPCFRDGQIIQVKWIWRLGWGWGWQLVLAGITVSYLGNRILKSHNWFQRYSNFIAKKGFTPLLFTVFLLPFTKVETEINQIQKDFLGKNNAKCHNLQFWLWKCQQWPPQFFFFFSVVASYCWWI